MLFHPKSPIFPNFCIPTQTLDARRFTKFERLNDEHQTEYRNNRRHSLKYDDIISYYYNNKTVVNNTKYGQK